MNRYRNTIISTSRSWFQAYTAFLLSKDENFILKIAPILLIAGSPEIVLSNVIPFVGEFVDIGGIGLTAIVGAATFRAVRKYR